MRQRTVVPYVDPAAFRSFTNHIRGVREALVVIGHRLHKVLEPAMRNLAEVGAVMALRRAEAIPDGRRRHGAVKRARDHLRHLRKRQR